LDNEISQETDHQPEESNQNDSSSFVTTPYDLLTPQLLVQNSLAYNSCSGSSSIYKPQASEQNTHAAGKTRGENFESYLSLI